MGPVHKDVTARGRIRHHLATRGPIEDATGRATRVLRLAVAYQGSPAAFMQLLAAMDRDSEIERSIRGKRTFRIAGADRAAVAHDPTGAQPLPAAATPQFDYERMARAVVNELVGRLAATSAMDRAEPQPAASRPDDAAAAEHARLVADRNDYARRLEQARRQLDEMLDLAEASKAMDVPPNVGANPLFISAGDTAS